MQRNLKFEIEYDGTDFAGWAKQPGLPSIEASLEEVLGRILQQDISLSVAGRTDAGVHARGQVVSLQTGGAVDAGKLLRSANQLLPEGIVITGIDAMPEHFDARCSALSRSYSYTVLNRAYPSAFRHRYLFHYPGRLDEDLLVAAAGLITGSHDFTAFTPTRTEHSYFSRTIDKSCWRREGELLIYDIRSTSFMRNMVRVLVGTMLEIGRGYRPLSDLEVLLEGVERSRAGKTAPACGLCLEQVHY